MQLIKWHGGSALIGKDRLQQLATLKDDKKGGVYALCRAADSSANDPKTVLYYTETSMSQPVLIQDESVVENARKALLDWHKMDDNCKNCVEGSTPGNWDLCEEAQEMLAQS